MQKASKNPKLFPSTMKQHQALKATLRQKIDPHRESPDWSDFGTRSPVTPLPRCYCCNVLYLHRRDIIKYCERTVESHTSYASFVHKCLYIENIPS